MLVSIILGLGLTELLGVLARVLRGEWKAGLVHSLWAFHTGLMLVQQFWSRWSWADRTDWSFAQLGVFLLPPLLGFLAASVISPDRTDDVTLDDYFLANRRPFFAVMCLLLVSYGLEAWFILGDANLDYNAIRLVMIGLYLVPMASDRRGVQIGVALITTAALGAFSLIETGTLSELLSANG
ncbi:MAG: hypothetical protein R3195_17285 [Gemmatimonadota bacterium]|nr:hypothetical protein [Gemmatimonadota bacterium]